MRTSAQAASATWEPDVQPIVLRPDEVAPVLHRFRVVDVRDADEFAGDVGHIPGAELAPAHSIDQAARRWWRAEPLLVVCRTNRRAHAAATRLLDMGFRAVHTLDGGMLAWHGAGLPVCIDGHGGVCPHGTSGQRGAP